MSLLLDILNWDRYLFRKINGEWTNSFFDWMLPYTRNASIWLPLYIFFIVFAAVNYKRRGLFWIMMGIVTVATSDLVSSWGIKELIFRVRPCRDPSFTTPIRFLVKYCPQSSSFTSSHAANHFAMAMFIFMTLKDEMGKWLALIFFWALIICYAQVYVGVHYPFDVIGGAIIGMLIGYLWARFSRRHFPLVRAI